MGLPNMDILGWYGVWYENCHRYNNLLILYEFVLYWKPVLDYYTAEIKNEIKNNFVKYQTIKHPKVRLSQQNSISRVTHFIINVHFSSYKLI
jgi:hypothetical protein